MGKVGYEGVKYCQINEKKQGFVQNKKISNSKVPTLLHILVTYKPPDCYLVRE